MLTLQELEPRAKEMLAKEQHSYEQKNPKSREAYQRSCRVLPGGVGNPKGRPKSNKSVGQMIEDALMTKVKVEENGKSRIMTAQEFIFRNLVRAAARGSWPVASSHA